MASVAADPHNLHMCCSNNYIPHCKSSGVSEETNLQTSREVITVFEDFLLLLIFIDRKNPQTTKL